MQDFFCESKNSNCWQTREKRWRTRIWKGQDGLRRLISLHSRLFFCCNAYKTMTQTLEFYQRHSCSYSHVFGTKHRTHLLTSQITYLKINYCCVTETTFGRYFYQIFQVWENLLFYWSGILGLNSYWVWTREWAFGKRKRLQWVSSGDLTDERREAELEKITA